MKSIEIEKLIIDNRNSSFRKDGSSVSINIKNKARFLNSLKLYTDYDNSEQSESRNDIKQFFERAVPKFQRDNDIWTLEMKQKFILNVLKGFKTEIKLFRMSESEDAKIIDGLQRLTAILEFLDGEFPILGDIYFEDIKDKIVYLTPSLFVVLYTFDSMEEVGKFYIDMNENITHSKEDIDKCKNFFKKEYGVIL